MAEVISQQLFVDRAVALTISCKHECRFYELKTQNNKIKPLNSI